MFRVKNIAKVNLLIMLIKGSHWLPFSCLGIIKNGPPGNFYSSLTLGFIHCLCDDRISGGSHIGFVVFSFCIKALGWELLFFSVAWMSGTGWVR